MSFQSDFAGAIVVEAKTYGYTGVPNEPVAIGLHTPEELADATPSTPWYFHNLPDGRFASTQYFVAWTGFVFQCVPELAGAYGNAVEGKPWPWWAKQASWGGYLNCQTISIEIEGYARDIHLTMPRGSAQWVSLVRLMADICRRRPDVRIEWTFGHYQVSNQRTDPGQLDIGALKADVQALLGARKEWDEMATEAQIEAAAQRGAAAAVAAVDAKVNNILNWVGWWNNIGGRVDRFVRATDSGAIYETFSRIISGGTLITTRHHITAWWTGLARGFKPDGSNILNLHKEYPWMTEAWLQERYPKGNAIPNWTPPA